MDERMRFVIRLKDGEGMACLCREFGISRKTGYKILERYAVRLRAAPQASATRGKGARLQYHSRHPGPPRLGYPAQALQDTRRGHPSISRSESKRALVHRLQRRVPARQE